MKKSKLITKEEALKIARAQKGNLNSGSGMFYNLLENADPALLEFFEEKLAAVIQVGTAMGEHMAGLKPGTPEYNQLLNQMHNISQQTTFAGKRAQAQAEEEIKKAVKDDDGGGPDV